MKKAVQSGVKLDRSLIHLLHRASQTADETFAALADEMDITPRQFVVLSAIASSPSSSQTAIVETTGIDRSTLAEMVRRLEGRGLLRRKRSKLDARAYVVDLTSKGRNLLKRVEPVIAKADKALLGMLGRKRGAELVKLLDVVIEGSA